MQKNAAFVLLIVTLMLTALGLVMLVSTSSMHATTHPEAVYGNLRKQCFWLVIGGIACVTFSRYDYQRWVGYAPWALGLAAILLAGCLIKGVGQTINGSPRWIHIGTWSYEPSEFAKVAIAVFLAWWLGCFDESHRTRRTFLWSLFIPTLLILPLLSVVAIEKDLGATAILLAISVSIFISARIPLIYLSPVPIFGVSGISILAAFDPVKFKRVKDWFDATYNMDPNTNLADQARSLADHASVMGSAMDQQLQALIALGSGGVWGLGLGDSLQKRGYLPEDNTDFVFAILGEEMGLIVTLAVVFAFLLLCLSGTWIAVHAPDTTGMLLGVSLTMLITVQALMNLAVVTDLMPCKGLPLPFISYGGSNLLTCLISVGILFNIQRQGVYEPVRRRVRPQLRPTNVRM